MEAKIQELYRLLISKNRPWPKDLNLLLITEKRCLKIEPEWISFNVTADEYGIANLTSLSRGKALDIFTKLEFLLGEIIKLRMIGYDRKKSPMFDEILKKLYLHPKIQILSKWGLLKGETKRIERLRKVRNSMAHEWGITKIKYQNGTIQTNFNDFCNDLKKIFIHLIEIYRKEQEKIDIDSIIKWVKKK